MHMCTASTAAALISAALATTTFTASLAATAALLLPPPSPQVTEAKSKLLEAKTKAMEMKAKVMQGVTPAQMRADRKAMYEMVCRQVRPPNLPSRLSLTNVRWHA